MWLPVLELRALLLCTSTEAISLVCVLPTVLSLESKRALLLHACQTEQEKPPSLRALHGSVGIMLVANKCVQKMFGYKKTEMEGKNVSMMMPQPFSQRHNGYLRNFINTGGCKGAWVAVKKWAGCLA